MSLEKKYPISIFLFALILMFLCPQSNAEDLFSETVGAVTIQAVNSTTPLVVPYITWGGEAALFHANGGLQTKPGSIMSNLGLNLKLVPGNDFPQQVRDYLAGKSPILRGTFRMISQASEVIGRDDRTKGVVFGQLTWSAGDHFVARSHIKKLTDLKGQKVVLQTGGPHVGMLYDLLWTARLSKSDVNIVWVDDLTGPNGPAERFRNDDSIAGCFVITPDMVALTDVFVPLVSTSPGADSQSEDTSTGKTVPGAYVVVGTATLSRSIADVYACRKDFYDTNKETIEKFFAGYLKGAEEVVKLKNAYEHSDSEEYAALLQMMQDIYGAEVLPTLEEDAHGLIADCIYVAQPGNVAFFNDPTNRVTGFEGFNKAGLDMAVNWGFATKRYDLIPSDLNFSSPTFKNLLMATDATPVHRKRFKAETVRAEVEALNENNVLDDKTLISFTIQFEPNQDTFSETQYRGEFDRVVELAEKYGNAAIAIKGHTDPSKMLATIIRTGLERGILKRTETGGNYRYLMNGQPFGLKDTRTLVKLIQQQKFDEGSNLEDPYQIMDAGLQLSEQRAEVVKQSIITYAHERNIRLEAEQIVPVGLGVKEPVIAKPTNPTQAAKNRRVEFALVKVSSEVVVHSDFDF